MLAAVFRYRTLMGRCDLGYGLELDEIEEVATIERDFAPRGEKTGNRRFRREKVTLGAILRGDQINDAVDVVEMGPGGLVCRKAPFIARGELVEIVIDDGDCSYRFRATGVWLRDDGEDYKVGLSFVGMPVCLHRVQLSRHVADVVDKIVAAAA